MFTLPLTPDQVPILFDAMLADFDKALIDALVGDERIAIIVGVSYIETLIEKLLDRHFVSSKNKKVSPFKDGLLDTFSSKLRMAYLLGILNEPSFNLLYKVKNLRNDCAHQINLDFNKGKTHGSQLDHIEELLKKPEQSVYLMFKPKAEEVGLFDGGHKGRIMLILTSLIICIETMIRLQQSEEIKVSSWSNMILPS